MANCKCRQCHRVMDCTSEELCEVCEQAHKEDCTCVACLVRGAKDCVVPPLSTATTQSLPLPLFELVYNELGLTEGEISRSVVRLLLSFAVTFDRKQHDYGPDNISAFGEKGVVVRMFDKMARIKKLVWTDDSPNNESIEDSYQDIAVYAAIATLCRRGLWA